MLKNKFYILFLVVVIYAFFSCKDSSNIYTVKGKLENVNDSVFFAARETGDSLIVDTIRINKKGEFSFTGSIDTLTVISLYFKEIVASPYVLVDKGWIVNVEGDIHYPDLILARGGEINNELTKFKEENGIILKDRSDMTISKAAISEKGDSVKSKNDVVELKNIDFELLNIAADYVKNNPSKISSVILLDNFFKNEESIERLSDGLAQLKGVAYDFPLAIQLREYRDKIKKSAIHSSAPAFRLKDNKGKEISLSNFKDKYVLLSFMSTTCKVCQEMLPDMMKAYKEIKKDKKEIEFVTIIKDIEEKAINLDFTKNITWTLIPEYGGWASVVFEDYNINEVPYNVLISKDGKILERNVSIYNLNSKIESYSNLKSK